MSAVAPLQNNNPGLPPVPILGYVHPHTLGIRLNK